MTKVKPEPATTATPEWVAEAKRLIADGEGKIRTAEILAARAELSLDDVKRAYYDSLREIFKREQKADTKLSARGIDRALGKPNGWSAAILKWSGDRSTLPFEDAAYRAERTRRVALLKEAKESGERALRAHEERQATEQRRAAESAAERQRAHEARQEQYHPSVAQADQAERTEPRPEPEVRAAAERARARQEQEERLRREAAAEEELRRASANHSPPVASKPVFDRARIAKLILMLSSPVDGEALNAARAICSACDIHQLAALVRGEEP